MDIVKFEEIQNLIVNLNGQPVVDRDVSSIYDVETKRINEAIKHDPEKFPKDYIYETSDEEFAYLRSKFSTANFPRSGQNIKYLQKKNYIMIATVLKSKKALDATFAIIETFSKIRELNRAEFRSFEI